MNHRKALELERLAAHLLKAQGYVVHKAVRHSKERGGRYYSAGNDIWGCIDIQAKRRGTPVRFIQVTSITGTAAKKRDLEAVPWDPELESVEIWRWVDATPTLGSHFQVYRLDEDYEFDAGNRIFTPRRIPKKMSASGTLT